MGGWSEHGQLNTSVYLRKTRNERKREEEGKEEPVHD